MVQWNPSIRTPQFSEHPLFLNTTLLMRRAKLVSLNIDSKLCFRTPCDFPNTFGATSKCSDRGVPLYNFCHFQILFLIKLECLHSVFCYGSCQSSVFLFLYFLYWIHKNEVWLNNFQISTFWVLASFTNSVEHYIPKHVKTSLISVFYR